MKKNLRYSFLIGALAVVFIVIYVGSLSAITKRTISFVPSEVTKFLYAYLDTCVNHPKDTLPYTHFETENEEEAYSISNVELTGYTLTAAEKVNDSLYAFTVYIERELEGPPKRYYMVGYIDGELRVMVNSGNVPEELQEGFRAERFTLTPEDRNGEIFVSAENVE